MATGDDDDDDDNGDGVTGDGRWVCYLSKGLVTSLVGARASPNTVASWTLI